MKINVIMTILTVIICGGLFVLHPVEKPTEVTVSIVKKINVIDRIISKGTVESAQVCGFYPSAGKGRIKRSYVGLGEEVKRGDILFELEKTEEEPSGSASAADEVTKLIESAEVLGVGIPDNAQDIIAVFGAGAGISDRVTENAGEFEAFVRSPINGTVTELKGEQGDVVGGTFGKVSDLKNLRIRAEIRESYANSIKVGMPAEIRCDALPGTVYSGVVTFIMPVAKPARSFSDGATIEAVITVINPDEHIIPGYSTSLTILTKEKNGVLTVPYETIIQDKNNREAVYILSGGRAKKQEIITGYELDDSIEVVSGLQEGDYVIINPDKDIENGSMVITAESGDAG